MFERGRVYRRSELHLAYASDTQVQQQGGILTPKGQPFLLVITGESGLRHGYHDFWDESGVLNYYGAGQAGDMQWRGGNSQLRDHAQIGKDVHVFEEEDARLRYRGQFTSAGFYERDGVPDTHGDPRRAFVFLLVPLEDVEADAPGLDDDAPAITDVARWTMSLEDLRQRAGRTIGREPKSRVGKRRVWERSHDLRIYVKRRAGGICEGCELSAPFEDRSGHPYLEPHHTRRLSDGGPDDPHYVIALCPTCHRRVHSGCDGKAYNASLEERLTSIEPAEASAPG